MTSPTQRTLKYLRAEGYTVAVVEKFNTYAKVRQDLFGILDILAMKPGLPWLLGIQTTTTANLAHREKKIRESPHFDLWRNTGNKIMVHGWAKRGPRKKRKVWTLTAKDIC